ncbi:MAG: FecR domain-containing protein [Bacteroidales bacterium]|nr:FecR domain-containing protein [Bacteroidales bacterium]
MKKKSDFQFEDFISDETFLEYAKGTNPDNIKLWETWLAENPDKNKTATEAKKFIQLINFKKQSLPHEFIDKEWDRLNKCLNIDKQRTISGFKKFKLKIWQYAAVFTLFISLLGAVLFSKSFFFQDKNIAYNEITALKGQIKNILLPDGSLVFLNSDTRLKYGSNFGTKKREVFLEGEAFFDVTHDSHKPFFIHTSENTVKVLGTAFNVSAYPDENIHQISLERGKISISHDKGKSAMLNANQTYLLLCNKNQSKIFKTKNVEMYSSWKDGKIIFRNQRFADITRKLERSHNIGINIQNTKIEDLRYTGEFNINDDIRKILEIISLTTSINYEIKKDTIFIR